MYKISIVCLYLLHLTQSVLVNYDTEFDQFLVKYHKQYESAKELAYRKSIFADNLEYINNHNKNRHSRNLTYALAMNELGDISYKSREFKDMLGYSNRLSPNIININTPRNYTTDVSDLPSQVDWRSKNAVTPVKNQGSCGSCWSFSATGAVEGVWAINKGELLSLSEQQLMDCSGPEGDQSCNGGLMTNAFQYLIDANGSCGEQEYPYEAKDESCHVCKKVAYINGYENVEKNSEKALLEAVARQPVSIAIEADHQSFQFYSSGVLNDPECGYSLDHGNLLVGYGTENGQDYWISKNSWCTETLLPGQHTGQGSCSWGDHGYIKLARNVKDPRGMCGVAMDAAYPTL